MAIPPKRNVGAPLGNVNAEKKRVFDDALRRAIAQDRSDRIRGAAEQLLTLAASGEAWAIKELADRLDGRAVHAVALGANEHAGPVSIAVTFVKPDAG